MRDGSWRAFPADQPPPILANEINKKPREFLAAAKPLSPEDLHDILPTSFSQARVLHPTLFPGIAQCLWVEDSRPCITREVWTKLCLRIADNDRENLENLFNAARVSQIQSLFRAL